MGNTVITQLEQMSLEYDRLQKEINTNKNISKRQKSFIRTIYKTNRNDWLIQYGTVHVQ